MNREKLQKTREYLERIFLQNRDELKNIGVSLSTANATFGDADATMKINIVDVDDSGEKVNLLERDWSANAEWLGLKKEWLGKEIILNGKPFKIKGLDRKKRSKPVVVENDRGGIFIVAVDTVILKMNKI